jgi:ADP-ribose pyrophosphatase YjhB (NUDIX family)
MNPTIRESVRAVVLDEEGRILLSRVTPLGAVAGDRSLWVTLGGRVKSGEALPEALARELAEELRETRCEIGPEVWSADQVVNWGGTDIRLLEHFYLVRVRRADYVFIGVDEEEIATTHELRWWSDEEIAASRDKFVPCELAGLLADVQKSPPPDCRRVQLEPVG